MSRTALFMICLAIGFLVIVVTDGLEIMQTDSMSPEIVPYDVVIINTFEPYDSIMVGDIISYKKSSMPAPILHRVIERGNTLTTKGDANQEPIEPLDYDITDQEYIGKLAYVLPLGEYGMVLIPPYIYIVSAPIVFIILCINKTFRKFVKMGVRP